MRTLHLTLHAKAFEVMVTGEKDKEFRVNSKWITSRLIDKDGNPKKYDEVIFVNGYGPDKPRFKAEYKGFKRVLIPKVYKYSNGLEVKDLKFDDFEIKLGKILELKNYDKNTKKTNQGI